MTMMRGLWTAVCMTACAVAMGAMEPAEAMKSPLEYEREFADWMQRHHITFKDALEFAKRLQTYIANDIFILAHNAAHDLHGFTLGHNEFSHLSFDEFKVHMTGFKIPQGFTQQHLEANTSTVLRSANVPESIDWVEKGGVTPVKNQGMCGSCWAFSATGAIEGATFVSSGKLPSLSEQELVDCDTNDMGCNGGIMDHAFEWVEEHGGICSEQDYEYQAKGAVCRTCEEVVKVTGYQDVTPNDEQALKAAVAQQPVSVAIEADQPEFQFYKSGVFAKKCGTQLDHGVLVVGYGTDNGNKFWKVKNSWGDSWGEKGYIRLARETGEPAGKCGVAMYPSYPFAQLVKKDAERAPAVETTAPKSTPPVQKATEKKSKATPSLATLVGSSATISQCGDKEKSIIHFDDLEITPKSPKRGKPIVFFGNGDVKQGFETADFKLIVKLAGTQVYKHAGTICGDTHVPLPLGLGHIDVHGFACPMKQGKFENLKVHVNLPIIAPSGNYEIQLLSGNSNSEDSLFCVHVGLDLENDEDFKKGHVYEYLPNM
ncbi:TPA: hypothetical protein N0F65_005772 [Lagenidium giganteum]|uniref:Uncharacterized protein n=1 Tax=Lagenidium giganteum TaxID=4803 RepID=A0AAV2YTT3_9STRA|nr:TPA: hypothetical protein N0F65_005772 [Lagenidium giganteum]